MLKRMIEWLKFQFRIPEPIPTEYLERARYARCADQRRERAYASVYFIGS